ncbi:MAG: Asp-tRNA(Asn) amidotransferase GatCAB subunit C, partial [Candidatus Hydrothermarchaeaceae archaeon]
EDIKEEADKVLRELSSALGEIDLAETYYVVEDINVTRNDGGPSTDGNFKKIIKRNAPKSDEDGNFVMEMGKWVE